MADAGSYGAWVCPFCGGTATLNAPHPVLCVSRTCSCGAIGLAAPTRDLDEIVDDARRIFKVQIREESRGYDALLLDDLRRSGVEIRQGAREQVSSGVSKDYSSLWFRETGRKPCDLPLAHPPGHAPEIWYCSRCGRLSGEVPDECCHACGEKRPLRGVNITEWLCSACHRGTPGSPQYCEWCGASFGQGA